jgi:ribosomal-protein-alanine N-acetyltransferase
MLPDVITTARLVLRPSRESDARDVFGYARDPEVTRYLLWRPHVSLVETEAFLVSQIARRGKSPDQIWLITDASDGRALGMIGLQQSQNSVELGYVLGRAEWGKGYMTEAVIELSNLALAQPEIDRVFAICDVENAASARVLEKAGFELEGLLGKHTVFPNLSPVPRDVFSYSKVR